MRRLAAVVVHEVAHFAGLGEVEAEIVEAMVAGPYATPMTACEFAEDVRLLVREQGTDHLIGNWFVLDPEEGVAYHRDGGVASRYHPDSC